MYENLTSILIVFKIRIRQNNCSLELILAIKVGGGQVDYCKKIRKAVIYVAYICIDVFDVKF